ncbi:endoplasmic reticulum metallopeptidase 1 isoform X1 [Hydra vulgaris]|uniref:endoplasmic reticulum metallopeptidase 1 isoform X1 n=1 Tax=Hydra vulgaris TaxID=6087 RepID=UPI001F5EC960|nr:endoplasmic reticulum metallopeptidase 1 isoform X1 [Hydra vulgaris]
MFVRQRKVREQHRGDSYLDKKSNYIQLSNQKHFYGPVHFLIIVLSVSAIIYSVRVSDLFLPDPKNLTTENHTFSGFRAQKHLYDLTKIGHRVAGSYESDVEAVNLLIKKINAIKDEANKGFDIEIDLQTVSGSFAFVQKIVAFTSTYENITNVLVKISSNPTDTYLLANAHFDTVMGTEGASDDGVSCAVLLEVLRCIALSDPEKLKYGIIFLFNGAEEGGLAGSHGFVLEHKWFPLVKAVVNLEAAGSGGREFVFQTGPDHPWILQLYASSAKYPFASVVAQEIFEAGLVPSDTDFRVFVRYGNLVGIDLAYVSNGYIYHTRYDNADAIPIGSIQRSGDNILELIKSMANSDYLKDPAGYKHGNSIFYDVLGIFMVHYPFRLHKVLCYMTCFVVVLYILLKLYKQAKLSANPESASFASVFLSFCVINISNIFGILSGLAVSFILIKFNAMMTWYTHMWFAFPLFGLPTLFGISLGHCLGSIVIKKWVEVNIRSFLYAVLLTHSSILFVLNQFEIKSSFLVWLWLLFPFMCICLPYDYLKLTICRNHIKILVLHLIGSVVPSLITVYHLFILYKFFVPLFGRTGTEIPGDAVLALVTALTCIVILFYLINLIHGAKNGPKFVILLGLLSFIPLFIALSGQLKPFSIGYYTTPKRFFMQHILRTFHNSDGSIRKQDSGIWLQPMDYLHVQDINTIPFFKNMQRLECEGSYCSLPYYYSMRVIARKQWYLLGEKPDGGQNPLSSSIYKREIKENRIRFYFDIKGPDHMNIFLTLKAGVILADWSMYKQNGTHIYSELDYQEPSSEIYFVFYSHGYYASSWKFWMEFERTSDVSIDLAEMGLARHYLHGKMSRTKFLREAISALPTFVCETAWTSNYDSFTLR